MDKYKIRTGTDIRPLDNQRKNIDSLVMEYPFSILINGQKSAGKTTLLINLLTSKDLLAQKFNKIMIFSPTIDLDKKMKKLRTTPYITVKNTELENTIKRLRKQKGLLYDPAHCVIFDDIDYKKFSNIEFYDDISFDDLQDLIEYQSLIIKNFERENADKILIILDDMAGRKKIFKNEKFIDMLFKSRHYNISLIICTQAYNQIAKPIRLNNSLLILFENFNKKELYNIYSENTTMYSFDEFYEICKRVFSTPFQTIVFNRQNSANRTLQLGFKEFL